MTEYQALRVKRIIFIGQKSRLYRYGIVSDETLASRTPKSRNGQHTQYRKENKPETFVC